MPRIVPLSSLLVAIVYAPLAYGCTTSSAIWWLDGLLVITVICWLCHKAMEKQGFRVSVFAGVIVLLLASVAVIQVLNPHAVFDPKTWNLRLLPNGLPILPRTIDRATSLAQLPHLLTMGAGFLVLMDLCQFRDIRWMILRTMVVSGGIVALIGILEKAAGGDRLLWGHLPGSSLFFGTFRYHGNAASFLNLCWPAALGLFLRSVYQEKDVGRSLWGLAWLFIFGALFVNTSKFGHAAALPLLFGAFVIHSRHLPGDWYRLSWRNLLVTLVVVAVLAGLTVPTLSWTVSSWQRHLEDGLTWRLRMDAYGICLKMVRDVPLFGFGTGSFRILFPYYAVSLGDQIQGRWSHAHQDYLQTIIEWGWAGMAFWVCLILPPLVAQLIRSFGRFPDLSGSAALIGWVAILVHAMADFPLQIGAIHFYALLYLAILWRPRESKDRALVRDRRQRGAGL